jgi:GR25 family glycosyltransferase involved in LPS biosynthesis
MHVNDRAIENINYNQKILNCFEYIDNIEYFNGNTGNGWDVLNHMQIPLNVWNPYDGRKSEPLPGEYGIWISTINVWKKMIEDDIELMLVLEDDVVIQQDFVDKLNKCLSDLPKDFDFLSLYYFDGQNWEDEKTEVGSDYIKKSSNQYSAAQATVYSLSGAKKLLKLIKRKGIEYTNDCFIFKQSHERLVNGYSIKKDSNYFLVHDYKKIKSLIDPENFRSTENK